MTRPDITQRVNVVAGPHRWSCGLTVSHYDPSDPQSRVEVLVELASGKVVTCLACELRPDVYGADSSGLGDAT